ncbi:hypothetical protein AFL01nite_04870 [Aeromicrobium flavum]|uniref:Uncharacterized protein n=1 Tax=Aeromicrobium flavum TaxID=416568 RepID=A0A512HS02_9ACTN|nr:hypothetical protein [Aeromicrobium flavum]GEO88160.1 hypothetical protein AFL01nite_04870 [Aeromicrobium flavum]
MLLPAAKTAADAGASDSAISLIGLGGVVVGAVIGLAGVWLQTRHSRRLDERDQRRTLYAKILEQVGKLDTQDLWLEEIELQLRPYVENLGTERPSDAQLQSLDPENRRGWQSLVDKQAEHSQVASSLVTEIEHLVFQLELIAPEDTSRIGRAYATSQRDESVRDDLKDAYLAYGRRDLASGWLERRKLDKRAREKSSHLQT